MIAPPNQSSRRRRRYPNLPIQIKYAVMLSVVSGFISLVMVFVMAWFMQRNYSLFLGDELGISQELIRIIKTEQDLLEVSLFILFLFSIAVMFSASFFVTRKLTGPVSAIQRHLILFAEGDWSRTFRLRKNDEFKDLEKIINRVRHSHLSDSEAPSPTKLSIQSNKV